MKINLLLLFCLAAFSSPALALDFQKNAPLYEHLCEVNAEWKKIAPDADLLVPVKFSSDRERIQKHLELVENELRTREMSSLSASQKANRLRHLDVLHGYWRAGIFPTNHYHAARQPYFRDNFNVLCAVGFLLWEDGQRDAVNKINLENNYAYIAELTPKYPALSKWATENGFTLNELAWIQPAYDPVLPQMENWGGGGLNAGGRINVMEKDDDETLLFVAGQFSSIGGLSAKSIAVWDGLAWSALGGGVEGEIFALKYHKFGSKEKLYVAGDFHLPGQPSKQNVAEYDLLTGTWKGLQTGDMQGVVYTLHNQYGTLFIGGDFQKVDGKTSQNLAVYRDFYEEWNQSSHDIGFQTDGPVYDIKLVNNYLLVGGGFQQVYCHEEMLWTDAPHLVYYDWAGNWLTLTHSLPPVRSLAYFQGNIFVGHQFESSPIGETGISILKAGLWFETPCYTSGDNTIHGFMELNDNTLTAYGGFIVGGLTYGRGAANFYEDSTYPEGYLMADSTVRAMLRFKNEVYVAGDFSKMFNQNYPGMVRVKLESVPTDNPGDQLKVQVVATPDRLRVNYQGWEQEADLVVYDLQGRPLARQTLPSGDGEWALDVQSDWASGLYVWHLENANGRKVGKWVVAN
jgi:hypothetical protein